MELAEKVLPMFSIKYFTTRSNRSCLLIRCRLTISPGDNCVIDAIDDLVGALGIILAKSDDGKPTEADKILQQLFRRPGIACLKVQELPEGQRVDRNGNIASSEVGGDLTGHQFGVGAGNVDIHVSPLQQTVDRLLPALDLLDLI